MDDEQIMDAYEAGHLGNPPGFSGTDPRVLEFVKHNRFRRCDCLECRVVREAFQEN